MKHKMGLLSDPEYGSAKWVRVLRKIHTPLSFLCYVVALVWFVMLGNKAINSETYFSENALLPGLVTNAFNGEPAAKQFLSEFNDELTEKYEETDAMPVPWLVAKMSQLHLEVYTHNFTLNYPLGEGRVFKGTNVYGILRAPRTSSLEAIVVSAPFRPTSSPHKGTAAGIALMLSFAQFARPQKYWAKDIIFLITEHEQLGMQAWLEAYHGIQSEQETFYTSLGSFYKPNPFIDFSKTDMKWGEQEKCLNPGTLKGRSGSIQAAINLEFDEPKFKYIEVKIEGLNGQLPNLDLVNLVNKLCIKSGIHHTYQDRLSHSYSWVRTSGSKSDNYHAVMTMLGMVYTQFAGVPNGNHGLFHRFGIEAVTLEGRSAHDPAGPAPRLNSIHSANLYRLGVALESILRSLNNLLERFHQSYFFYLLAATNRFISIGLYMPSLCLLCAAMLIKSLALWVNIQKGAIATSPEKVPDDEKSTGGAKKHRRKTGESLRLVNIVMNYLLVHLLSYAIMQTPVIFTRIGWTYYKLKSEESIYYGFAIISILLVLFTPLMPKLLQKATLTYEEMTLVNVLVLIELATICLTVGMHNFSLGLCMGVLYTPLALVAGVVVKGEKSFSSSLRPLKQMMCLLCHPFSALTIGMTIYSKYLYSEEPLSIVLGKGRDASAHALTYSIVDSLIYGNWTFNVISSLILPTWVIFWQILCNKVQPE